MGGGGPDGNGPAHDAAVRCIEYSSEINAVVTGSWDATVKTWDARVAGGGKIWTSTKQLLHLLFINSLVMREDENETENESFRSF